MVTNVTKETIFKPTESNNKIVYNSPSEYAILERNYVPNTLIQQYPTIRSIYHYSSGNVTYTVPTGEKWLVVSAGVGAFSSPSTACRIYIKQAGLNLTELMGSGSATESATGGSLFLILESGQGIQLVGNAWATYYILK